MRWLGMLHVHVQRCSVGFGAQIVDIFLLYLRMKVSNHHCFGDLQIGLVQIPHR